MNPALYHLEWVEMGCNPESKFAPPASILLMMESHEYVIRLTTVGSAAKWLLTDIGMYELRRLTAKAGRE